MTDFSVSDRLQVADITGLEHLVNVTEFNLSTNKITDLSPLAELTTVTWLNVAFNDPYSSILHRQRLVCEMQTVTFDRAGRVGAADDFWGEEDVDFVDEIGVEEIAQKLPAAFHEEVGHAAAAEFF